MPSTSLDKPGAWRVRIYQWGSESNCRTKCVHALVLSQGQAIAPSARARRRVGSWCHLELNTWLIIGKTKQHD
jgi:hypothetical protein